ncbi:MAG TPA: DUF4199 domain-containing protein [Puia sp.]
MKKNSSDFMSKAILLALLLMVLDLIGGFAHLRFETWFKWIPTLVLCAALIIFCINYGKQLNNEVTFGKVFGYAFKIALIVSILIFLYSLLSSYVIFPELKDQLLENARADMQAKGGLTEDQIDQGMAMTKKFLQPIPIAIFGFLGTLVFGTIGALLGAAFTKKSEASVFQNNP